MMQHAESFHMVLQKLKQFELFLSSNFQDLFYDSGEDLTIHKNKVKEISPASILSFLISSSSRLIQG